MMGFQASRRLSKKDLGIEENIPITFANNLEQPNNTESSESDLKNSCLGKRLPLCQQEVSILGVEG